MPTELSDFYHYTQTNNNIPGDALIETEIIAFTIKFYIELGVRQANWTELMAQETGVQSQVESYQRLKKMVHDTSLFNIQYYKVSIKGKVEPSKERSSAFPYTSV